MIQCPGSIDLLGVPINPLWMDDVLDLCDQRIAERRQLLIGVVNAAKVVNMRRDGALREAVLSSDVILADGMSIVWAARLLGQPLPERVAGIDLFHRLLQLADEKAYRVYCLGATDEVLDTVVEKIKHDYPRLVLAGARNGYFGPEQEAEVANDIAAARADILFVAISPPKKEQFLGRWSKEIQIPICHGVGGSFDVMAGKTRRAPRIWQRLGMEWLYRVLQEPGRLWRRYLVTNTLFVLMVLRAMVGRISGQRCSDTANPAEQ